MNSIKKSLLSLTLASSAFVNSCQISPYTKRVSMFENRVGLPADLEEKENESFWEEKDRKKIIEIYKAICLLGIYNPKGRDADFVDPSEAKRLLIRYGWDETKFGFYSQRNDF